MFIILVLKDKDFYLYVISSLFIRVYYYILKKIECVDN